MSPPGRAACRKYDVAVRKSGIDGFGAFAAEAIAPCRKIGEIRGEEITVDDGPTHHAGTLACRCGAANCIGWL